MSDPQTGREVQALPGPAVAELRAASVGTTATLTAALQRWAQGQPRRGTVPAEGAAAVAALGQQVGPLLTMHLPRAEALATEHMRRQLGAATGAAPSAPSTTTIGEHLAGRAGEILSAELTRAHMRGLESFNPAAVAQEVVRRVVAAAVQTIRTELMRAYNATARALLDAAGRWRRWDAQLDSACTRCDALDGQIAEPGRPFFLEGVPVGDPPLHPYCHCTLVGQQPQSNRLMASSAEAGAEGDTRTPETDRVGLTSCREHPDAQRLLAQAEASGFTPTPNSNMEARAVVREVVHDDGRREVQFELVYDPRMRLLDLEHELGHIMQMRLLGIPPLCTERVRVRRDGQVTPHGDPQGVMSNDMDTVTEFHNRVVELRRLIGRGAPADVILVHSSALIQFRENARGVRPRTRRWVTEGLRDYEEQEAWFDEYARANSFQRVQRTRRGRM